MDRSEVEIEDVENLPEDLANGGRDTESNVVDTKVVREQDEVSSLAVANEQNSDGKMTEVQHNKKTEAEDLNNIEKETEAVSPGGKATEDQIVNEMLVERQNPTSDAAWEKIPSENGHTPLELPANESGRGENEVVEEPNEPMDKSSAKTDSADDIGGLSDVPENRNEGDETFATNETGRANSHLANKLEPTTPQSPVIYSATKAEAHSGEKPNNSLNDTKISEDDECGTTEEQAAFIKELERFYKAQSMDFKSPKFYGQPLNCLKLLDPSFGGK